jgi:hypothetical protein
MLGGDNQKSNGNESKIKNPVDFHQKLLSLTQEGVII